MAKGAGQDFGVIGMAVMGQNLALNIESRGYGVAVYNRTTSTMAAFVEEKCRGRNVTGAKTIKGFVAGLKRPRKAMIMVKAGAPVDATIEELLKHMQKGDIIIDGGNSFFKDTIRRCEMVESKGLLYIGTGVSGGEEGALKGPSMMPGGSRKAWTAIKPILTKAAAQVDGEPCCAYIGNNGAGHYVKMVHNGIEYGDMQLICEAYYIMANALGMSPAEQYEVFKKWNRGDLDSYLIEITRDILGTVDPDTGKPMVDVIMDKAGQKGTGKWTSQSALDLGVPAPTVAEAVFARCMSAAKDERLVAAKKLKGPKARKVAKKDRATWIKAIHDALYASKICSYAQGFTLMREAAKEYGWRLKMGEISMIWRGGCIIRAQFLRRIKAAFDRDPELANLLLDPHFQAIVEKSQKNWRKVVASATEMGIPVPAFSSALAYYDSYRRGRLSANLIQAQRDYFGAHTYERLDKAGSFHTDWVNVKP